MIEVEFYYVSILLITCVIIVCSEHLSASQIYAVILLPIQDAKVLPKSTANSRIGPSQSNQRYRSSLTGNLPEYEGFTSARSAAAVRLRQR